MDYVKCEEIYKKKNIYNINTFFTFLEIQTLCDFFLDEAHLPRIFWIYGNPLSPLKEVVKLFDNNPKNISKDARLALLFAIDLEINKNKYTDYLPFMVHLREKILSLITKHIQDENVIESLRTVLNSIK